MPPLVDFTIRVFAFIAGFSLTIYTIYSAVFTFVLPRATLVRLTSFVFQSLSWVFRVIQKLFRLYTYEKRDALWAPFAPIGLFILPLVWLLLIIIGYTGIFYSLRPEYGLREAYLLSGSSLMTLGFRVVDDTLIQSLAFSEAALSMMLIALLVGFLPTMYNAFSQREAQVNKLEVRAGTPPSALEMLMRFDRIGLFQPEKSGDLSSVLSPWEDWFASVEETHTTLAFLNFFRSPKSSNSWITAAGVVLDTCAFIVTTINIPYEYRFALVIRSGFVALRTIADYFGIEYDSNPQQGDPISITFEEFLDAYNQLRDAGLPMNADIDDAWLNFAGWRVNYDKVLLDLARLLNAPYAPWVSDRSAIRPRKHT